MKKRVKFDLSWRAWSLIVGFFILIGFVGLSLAYKSGASPSVMGHSAEEIEGGAGGTTIVSSCMPDYFNGVNKNNGVSYQAPTDGWVKYYTTIQYGTSTFSVSSNNISWVDLMSITAGDWPQRDLGSISLIKAGTYYKGIALTQFVFYPCLNSIGSTSNSSSLSCRIASSTSKDPVTVCCNSDEFATGVNSPELAIKSSFTSDKCVYFSEIDNNEQKQVVCCK